MQRSDPAVEPRRARQLATFRSERDGVAASDAVARVVAAASGDEQLMPLLREAFARRAALGEFCDALRGVWGQYR